jgi:DNA invertase Pin-like site-specific DNA recombinase
MTDARKRKFSVVLVAAFDRVARSTKHFLQVIDEFDSIGIEFVSRRENVDTSGPMGRLFLTLIGSIAELEADLIKERIRAGMRRRRLEGYRLGRAPLDVDRDALVTDRLNGMSLSKVAKKYHVSRASVIRFVRNAQLGNDYGQFAVTEQQAAVCVA